MLYAAPVQTVPLESTKTVTEKAAQFVSTVNTPVRRPSTTLAPTVPEASTSLTTRLMPRSTTTRTTAGNAPKESTRGPVGRRVRFAGEAHTLMVLARAGEIPEGTSCILRGQSSDTFYLVRSCSNCPGGKYNNDHHVNAAKHDEAIDCLNCAGGKYSSAGAYECSNCAAGSFSSSGASSCPVCGSGKYSSAGASSCTNCDAGTYNSDNGQHRTNHDTSR